MFAPVAPINEENFGLSPVYAAEEKSEKKQKTRRVPSLSESVYKKLGKGRKPLTL